MRLSGWVTKVLTNLIFTSCHTLKHEPAVAHYIEQCCHSSDRQSSSLPRAYGLGTRLSDRRHFWPLISKIGLDGTTHCLWWALGFKANWRPCWKDHPNLDICKQIILRGLRNRFRNATNMFSWTTLNVNVTKLFCGLHSMLLLLPTAAILEWPPEEYSGVTEKKMRTLTFST